MKIRFLRLIALVLTAAVLLSGCGMVDFGKYFGAVRSLVDGNAIVPYESMTYERGYDPAPADAGRRPARRRKGTMFRPFWTGIYDFYDAYDWFSTYHALADIHYCADLTDTYWGRSVQPLHPERGHGGRRLQELYGRFAQSPPGRNWSRRIFRRGLF